ncbi:hypothetical protein MASR1M66_04290 [Aminivibrio sp.]
MLTAAPFRGRLIKEEISWQVPSDIEIAQNAELHPIVEIAQKLGIEENELELYGKYRRRSLPRSGRG